MRSQKESDTRPLGVSLSFFLTTVLIYCAVMAFSVDVFSSTASTKTTLQDELLSQDQVSQELEVSSSAATTDSSSRQSLDNTTRQVLAAKLARQSSVRVIVELDASLPKPLQSLNVLRGLARRQAVNSLQTDFQQKVTAVGARILAQHQHIPFTTLEVDSTTLTQLAAMPEVVGIQEDFLLSPVLSTSIPVIGADELALAGITGENQVIAILDTGVDSSHPFLAGKVIEEGCFSTTDSSSTSYCAGGAPQSTGPGSASPCVGKSCDHGTHVAGIAAGRDSASRGVAPDASLIAVQVFSGFHNENICGSAATTPCALAYTSDVLRGLEYIYSLRELHDIAAVNLSLGGGVYDNAIRCDSAQPSTKQMVDLLKEAGVAVVAASGNGGQSRRLQSPSCLSTAISVGASTDADNLSGFSNAASWLDLLAPGTLVRSSVPGGGFESWNGTSMATPHVAGAMALIRSVAPEATVDQMLAGLSNTGKGIALPTTGFFKPRISLVEALALFESGRRFPVNVIVDNDYGVTLGNGDFELITDASGYNGRYLLSRGVNDTYRFIPDLPVSGHYRLYAWWSQQATSNQVIYEVKHALGETQVQVDQSVGGGNWRELGTFQFDQGDSGQIMVYDQLSGAIVADAVKFELLDTGALTIENINLPPAHVGELYDVELRGAGGLQPYLWDLQGTMPPGVVFDPQTARIFGTPEPGSAGEWPLLVHLFDADKVSVAEEFILSVVAPPEEIIIDNADPQTWSSGQWNSSSGVLPWAGGSVFSNKDGVFRWLPDIDTSGTYEVYVWWTYHKNRSTTVPYTISSHQQQSTIIVNQRTESLGGKWFLLGSFYFEAGESAYIQVSSDNGQASADAIRLVAVDTTPLPLSVVTQSLPDATQGQFYQASIEVSGGSPPYHFSVTDSLPGGLELLFDTGEIRGDVSESLLGDYWSTFEITDAIGERIEKRLKIVIKEFVPLPAEIIIDNLDANTDREGEWLLSSGALPWAGGSVYSNNDGRFVWRPESLAAGSFDIYAWWTYHQNRSSQVEYSVQDHNGLTSVMTNQKDSTLAGQWNLLGRFTFAADGSAYIDVTSKHGQASADAIRLVSVDVPLSIDSGVLEEAQVDVDYVNQLRASGGYPPYYWSVSGTLPQGLHLDENEGLLSGVPGDGEQGVWPLTIRVTDQQGQVSQQALSLTVADAPPLVELYLDDQDARASRSGNWYNSSGAYPWQTGSLYSYRSANFRWLPVIPKHNRYQVYAWWTHHDNRATTVPYRIKHQAGVSEVIVNQRDASLAGRWILLGNYEFSAGENSYVEVSGDNGQACADGIRLVECRGGVCP